MNPIVRFISDTASLGAVMLGLSLAVAALSGALNSGFKFITVDKLPLHKALPLAVLYPLVSPARVARRLYLRHRRITTRAAALAAHPAGKRTVFSATSSTGYDIARTASMAAHPSAYQPIDSQLHSADTDTWVDGRHLHLVRGNDNRTA